MSYLFKNNKLSAILIIATSYYIFLYPQSFDTLIIGSISSDHLIQTQKYIVNFFTNFDYPYIYNLGHGFDLIATSIHSSLHPFYFFINIFLTEKILLKETFVKIHMLLFIVGFFFYLRKKVKSKTILYLLIIAFTNSIVITSNIPHAFLICVYSYIPWLLIMVEKIIRKQKLKHFIYFSLILFLMIMVGHFQHQFIFLTFLITFLIIKVIKKNISVLLFFKICCFILIAFIFSLPQLLPVYDLMIMGERNSTGSLSRFDQSVNGFVIIGYFLPGLIWTFFKHYSEYYNLFTTSPSMVEGLHYIGIFTLSLFFFLVKKTVNNIKNDPIQITIIFLILRGLGVYFFLNLFLNYLPIFGQFRAPVRNLYLVDFLMIVFISLNFDKYFSLKEFRNFFKIFLKYYVILLFFLCIIGLIFINKDIKEIEFQDYFLVFFNLFILILISLTLKYLKNKKFTLLIFLLLTLIDLSLHKYSTPLNSKIEQKNNYTTGVSFYENLCVQNNTNSIITLFDHSEINNDLPRFRYGNEKKDHFIINKTSNNNSDSFFGNYIYTYNCNISMGVRPFTMATEGATNLHNLVYFDSLDIYNFKTKEKIYLLSLLGYSHFLNYNNSKIKVLDKNQIVDLDTYEIDQIIKNKFFDTKIDNKKFIKKLNLLFYEILDKSSFKNLLTTFNADVKQIDNLKFIGFGGTKNLIIKDLDNNIVDYEIYDPFIKVLTNKKILELTYVPTPFLVGFILILPLILLLVLSYIIFTKFAPVIFNFTKNKFLTKLKSFRINTSHNFLPSFEKFMIAFSCIMIIICTLYLFLAGKEKILINGAQISTLKFSSLFIIYFLFSIFIILKILDFKLKNYKFKLFIFVLLNILIGTTLIGELEVYNTPQILIEKYNFKEENILIIKSFLKNYVW